jgi:hypothetical protein
MTADGYSALTAALLALGALLHPASASASLYKCKDTTGNVAYSDKPCPASGEQESIRITADSTEYFLTRIVTIAQAGATSQPDAVQRALSVTLQEAGRARYVWANSAHTPGLPAMRIALTADSEKNGRAVLVLSFTSHLQCISQATVNRVFQPAFNMANPRAASEHDISEHQQRYLYDYASQGKTRLVLGVRYGMHQTRKSRETCLNQIELFQNQ